MKLGESRRLKRCHHLGGGEGYKGLTPRLLSRVAPLLVTTIQQHRPLSKIERGRMCIHTLSSPLSLLEIEMSSLGLDTSLFLYFTSLPHLFKGLKMAQALEPFVKPFPHFQFFMAFWRKVVLIFVVLILILIYQNMMSIDYLFFKKKSEHTKNKNYLSLKCYKNDKMARKIIT